MISLSNTHFIILTNTNYLSHQALKRNKKEVYFAIFAIGLSKNISFFLTHIMLSKKTEGERFAKVLHKLNSVSEKSEQSKQPSVQSSFYQNLSTHS